MKADAQDDSSAATTTPTPSVDPVATPAHTATLKPSEDPIVGVNPDGSPVVPDNINGGGTDDGKGGEGKVGGANAPPAAPGLDLYKLKPWDCTMSEDKLPLTTTLCIKSSFLMPIITEFQSKMSKQVEEGFNKLDFEKFKKYDDTSTEIKVDKFALD